jgi:limonene-1,2-epoxide hydrolase
VTTEPIATVEGFLDAFAAMDLDTALVAFLQRLDHEWRELPVNNDFDVATMAKIHGPNA